MKKSACIEMIFTELPFYERIKAAKDAGFNYIEFWDWTDKDLDQIKVLCQEHGVQVASFSGDREYSLVDRSHVEPYIAHVKKSIEAAKYLGYPNLVIHSNALGEGGMVVNHYEDRSDYEKFGVMVHVLTRLAPIAEEADVHLVLEALNTYVDHVGNFLAYTKDAVTAIRVVGSSHIKILYDLYHMQLMEGRIVGNIEDYIHDIGYIHVADAPGRQEPGTGEVHFDRVWRALCEKDYQGFIGFELEPSRESGEVAKELVAAF